MYRLVKKEKENLRFYSTLSQYTCNEKNLIYIYIYIDVFPFLAREEEK